MKSADKINRMYKAYGKNVHEKCGHCCNFISGKYNGKTYSKCLAYGATHCEATDWSRRHMACGIFAEPFDESKRRPLIEVYKAGRTVNQQIEGQMEMEI